MFERCARATLATSTVCDPDKALVEAVAVKAVAAKPFIKTKKKPVVDQTPIKIDSSPIKFRSPVYQPDYAALQAANRLRQLQRQSELQKIKDANTGIGYLVGGLRFKS